MIYQKRLIDDAICFGTTNCLSCYGECVIVVSPVTPVTVIVIPFT